MNETGGEIRRRMGSARPGGGLHRPAGARLHRRRLAGMARHIARGDGRPCRATLRFRRSRRRRCSTATLLLGGRVNDLVGGLSDDAVIAREQELHDRLGAMIAGFPQVTAVIVVGRSGQPLVATSRYPVDRNVNLSDREYFRALRDSHLPFYIGGIVFGRITGADVFSVATRRGDDPSRFSGVILRRGLAHLFPRFRSRYVRRRHRLQCQPGSRRRNAVGELSRNGAPEPGEPVRDELLVDAIARKPQAGLVRGRSAADDIDRLIAYRRLATYPVYITVGRRWDSIVGNGAI